jgi:hypothetical protein
MFSWTNKLNPSRRCSLLSQQRILLRWWLTKILDSSVETVRRLRQFRRKTSEVTGTEQSRRKWYQTRSLWFMCYKTVQWIIVAQPSERSNKPKCQIRNPGITVALPRNHGTIYIHIYIACESLSFPLNVSLSHIMPPTSKSCTDKWVNLFGCGSFNSRILSRFR